MPACRKFTIDDIKAATALLKSFGWDTDAVIQLLVVANSFRGMLGVKETLEANHGECVKAS